MVEYMHPDIFSVIACLLKYLDPEHELTLALCFNSSLNRKKNPHFKEKRENG